MEMFCEKAQISKHCATNSLVRAEMMQQNSVRAVYISRFVSEMTRSLCGCTSKASRAQSYELLCSFYENMGTGDLQAKNRQVEVCQFKNHNNGTLNWPAMVK